MLNFWASWCTPCRKEFPLLRNEVAAKGDVALDRGEHPGLRRQRRRKFAEEQHADWPNGFDRDEAVRRGYGVTGLPETFFIDADGVIRSHVIQGLADKVLQQQLAEITTPAKR